MVLASENSRPILTRLGFETLSHVTRYLWKPATGEELSANEN